MCGRFSGTLTLEEIKKLFYSMPVDGLDFAGSYNIAPTELASIIIEKPGHERETRLARFGMEMNAGGKTFPLINIQSEKAANRADFKSRRCIIPATGFYEWEKVTPKDKQPYYFSPKEGVFAFAGVWKKEKDGYGFTILTTKANALVGNVHARMPVILSHNATGEWLAPDAESETLSGLMESYPANLMQAWKVSKAVNSPKNKEATCINSL